MRKLIRSGLHSARQLIRARILSGLLIVVPTGVTFIVLKFFFDATLGTLIPLLRSLFGELPIYTATILAIAVIFAVVYFAGLLTSMVIGRRLIGLVERLVGSIPFVKTIYSASKQVIELFQSPVEEGLKHVAMVEFPGSGLRAVGFVTGRVRPADGSDCYTVFIPTTPNPTTGFLEIVPVERCELMAMSVEEAVRFIMSAGMLPPPELRPSGEKRTAPAGTLKAS